jgi:integrase/recombinase XerD
MTYRRPPSNRRPRKDALLTVDDIYRQPVGPASDPKSLYALLLRFVTWRRERNWSETTLKVQTHHSYRFICWANERGISYAAEVTRPLLERYQRWLYQYRKGNGEALTSRTQRTAVQPLQVWFRWMTQQHLLLANPAADLELPRLEKRLPRTILSVEQVEDVLSQCDLTTLQGIRDRALLELLWSTGIRRGEVERLKVCSVDAGRKILTIIQGKGKQDRIVPVGERALWWVNRWLHHVRPEVLVNPDCKALFLAMDGVAGLTVARHHAGGGAVPESVRHRERKLPPVPPRDGDADAGERRGPALDTGDAGAPQRGKHANLHAGEHPGVAGGTQFNPSGRAAGQRHI